MCRIRNLKVYKRLNDKPYIHFLPPDVAVSADLQSYPSCARGVLKKLQAEDVGAYLPFWGLRPRERGWVQ